MIFSKEYFGDIRFFGVKYLDKREWIAKAQFNGDFENLTADGEDISDALRNLKARIKKIIKRYNEV